MQNNEFRVETVTKEEDVQIYKVEGEDVSITFTNSTKTGRLYIDGKGSRKHREKIIEAVMNHDKDVTIGKPSRISLPVMISVKLNDKNSTMKTEDYVKAKLADLRSKKNINVTEEEIVDQLHVIFDNHKEKELSEIGENIKSDII